MVMAPVTDSTTDMPSLITSRYHGPCEWWSILTKSSCLISKSALSVAINDPPTVPPKAITLQIKYHFINHPTEYSIHRPTGKPGRLVQQPIDRPTAQPINRSIDHQSEQPTHWPNNRTDRLNEKPINWLNNLPTKLTNWLANRFTSDLPPHHLMDWQTDRATDPAIIWLTKTNGQSDQRNNYRTRKWTK
jgi:hypothetical protein